ncbi:glycosyltransferase [Pseudomonas citronellolis]|uniref:glycosyltransferase n=1 Tax=Pseudomonas citronellolis TaxID=53408 RepID=UPI0010663B04|nr:glycosyltransferase [Pseudomonas humi]
MKKLNFIIFPYRNLHFKKIFGDTVRDLQIIEVLKSSSFVENILIVDRPISLYELALRRNHKGDNYLKNISLDIFGPIKRRSWTENCYACLDKKINKETKDWGNTVILDFTPIAKIPISKIKHDFYWYDLIDNFTKHNRFNEKQKKLVAEKYEIVTKLANMITGVSTAALARFPPEKSITLPNGYFPHSKNTYSEPKYKYGFLGFITNKFDIDFIESLSRNDPDFSLLICGEILDKETSAKLRIIKNVTLHGKFSRNETPELISCFEIGLIPYLKSKSHDGSPLKLYEYMEFGRPILTSIDYETQSEYIINYNKHETRKTIEMINKIIKDNTHQEKIKSLIKINDYIETKIKNIIHLIPPR